MKKLLSLTTLVLLLASCGTSKTTAPATYTPTEPTREVVKSLEGEKVIKETVKDNDVAYAKSLSEDGMSIVEVPYQWFSGTHTADNKQLAIEMARREETATIARVFNTIVSDKAEKATIEVEGKVYDALKSYWSQQSMAILNGCEPFGEVEVEYSPTTRMYTATAKVAMRGDRFNKALESAGTYRPENLTQDEMDSFIELNKSIIEAAKGE